MPLRKLIRTAIAFALCCVAACAEAVYPLPSPLSSAPPMPSSGATAYITVSNLSPAVGDTVTVSLSMLEGAGGQAVGSFALRVAHARAGLRYVGMIPLAEGMIAANASDSTIMIAGASSVGFMSGTLAKMRMIVLDRSAIPSLALKVIELNSIAYADKARFTKVDHSVFAYPLPSDHR